MSNGQTPPPRPPRTVDLGDADLNAKISEGMSAVEQLLTSELHTGEEFIVDKVVHLAKAGGKRFRPMMSLLASQYGPEAGSERVVKAAGVIEIVHLATLYHDDVMDEADRRRGVESANERWDNSVAILAGDVLLAHASRLMAQLDTRTVNHFAETFSELVTGQMRETIGETPDLTPIEHYTKVIEEKTGVLIGSAGYLGAMHGGADEEHVDALYQLGRIIGVIFQIVDDVIDIYSEAGESGKTPGTDLREGVFTLPVLYALEEDSEVGGQLRELLTGPLDSDEDVEKALGLLERSTGRARTLEAIDDYLAKAEKQIARLPEGPTTDALRQLSRYTISRVG